MEDKIVTGLDRITPCLDSQLAEHKAYLKHDRSFRDQYMEMIQQKGPFDLFITLTFRSYTSYLKICQFTNELIHRYNQKLFTRDYRDKGRFLTGFAFFEDHPSSYLKDRPHIHMLLKLDQMTKARASKTELYFFKAASNIRDGKRLVFSPGCMDLQTVRDDGVIGYCMKNIWGKSLRRVKPIGVDGLSDKLWHIEH